MILPMSRPPLLDGAVLVRSGLLEAVGSWKELRASPYDELQDLGEALLLPGLINAHCHLDYSDMAGHLSPPKAFPDWIKGMLALKAQWSYSDYAASWLHGAHMLLRHGTTTVADVESVPELLPDIISATPLRVCSLLELTGVRSRRSPEAILKGALSTIEQLPPGADWAGLSPHAPYSTTPELIHLAATATRRQGWPLTIHVSESAEEFDMYLHRQGAMFEWLESQRPMSDCGLGSPVQHLHRLGALGRNLLAVHANYLAPGDAALLGQAQCSVVHCPRSHEYFGHAPFQYQQLVAAGVNVCLGTDSLASVRVRGREHLELDLFAEMRSMHRSLPALSPEGVVRLATVNGARALGLAGRLGELSPGAMADLVTIPFSGKKSEAYEVVAAYRGHVIGVMIKGQWLPKL
jgi:cytosine/adenosine deaminase-related metal-dependent hydrolase